LDLCAERESVVVNVRQNIEAYKVQVRRSIVKLKGQHIVGQRYKEQRPLADASLSKYTSFLEQLV
jgi:hypothetical protein